MDAPGRGLENWFTGNEAFALLTGLRLMRDGWPQGLVVAVLRRVNPRLEAGPNGLATRGYGDERCVRKSVRTRALNGADLQAE
jgi:hypothetical protein